MRLLRRNCQHSGQISGGSRNDPFWRKAVISCCLFAATKSDAVKTIALP
jgi:hypothetical protein